VLIQENRLRVARRPGQHGPEDAEVVVLAAFEAPIVLAVFQTVDHVSAVSRAADIAKASSVGVTTIRRAELTADETSMTTANDLAIWRALEAAGVEFTDENGGGPGVGCACRSTRSRESR
jgi:hypothetical protein